MACQCNRNTTIELGDDAPSYSYDPTSYPNDNTAGQIMQDVSYPDTNQFITGVLWGAKWNVTKIYWAINWGNQSSTALDGTFFTPSSETITIVDNMMTDLGNIIAIPVEKTTDASLAIISINFTSNTNIVSGLGRASPPRNTTEYSYTSNAANTSIVDNKATAYYAPGNSWSFATSSTDFTPGGFDYITLIHELGHALGLAHPHDTGGISTIFNGVTSAFYDYGDANANQQPFSVMTYNDTTGSFTPQTNALSGFLSTFGAIDIAALQFMYGKNENYKPTNNIYQLGSSQNGTNWVTINNANNTNEISASELTQNVIIDLRSATIDNNAEYAGIFLSSTNGIYGGYSIALGTTVLKATGGSGNDQITGNSGNNTIDLSEGGTDTVDGGAGIDTINISADSTQFTINENTDNVTVTDGNQYNITLTNCEYIEFTDKTYTVGQGFPDSRNENIGYGTVELTNCIGSNNWTQITFPNSQTYENPVIIVGDLTYNGGDYSVIRVKDITATGCSIGIQESTSDDNSFHTTETVSYIVGDVGTTTIGSQTFTFYKENTNLLTSSEFNSLQYSNIDSSLDFVNPPNVFTQIQTYNGTDCTNTRTRNISNSGFEYAMQETEALNSTGHVQESIGILIAGGGSSVSGNVTFLTGTSAASYNLNLAIVPYDIPFNGIPQQLIAKISSGNGLDPCTYRVNCNSTVGFAGSLQEDKTQDDDRSHINESISYLAIYDSSL